MRFSGLVPEERISTCILFFNYNYFKYFIDMIQTAIDLSDFVKELEELKAEEANELKDKIKSILNSVEKILDQKDG